MISVSALNRHKGHSVVPKPADPHRLRFLFMETTGAGRKSMAYGGRPCGWALAYAANAGAMDEKRSAG